MKKRAEQIASFIEKAGITAEVLEFNEQVRISIGEDNVRNFVKMEELLEKVTDMDDQEIAEELIKAYTEGSKEREKVEKEAKKLLDWELSRDKVRILLLPKENREEVLTRDFLDLKLVPVVKMLRNGEETIQSKVTNALLDKWEISEEELWERATFNTKKNVIIRDIADMYEDIVDEMDLPEEFKQMIMEKMRENPLLVCTTVDDFGGAAAVAMEGVLWPMANHHHKDIIIIPSSINETLLLPYDPEEMTRERLVEMVKEANAEIVEKQGAKLSDNVYIYRRNKNTIEIFE